MKKLLMLLLGAVVFTAQAENLNDFNQRMDKEMTELLKKNEAKIKTQSDAVKLVTGKFREQEKAFLEANKNTCIEEKLGDEKACGCFIEKSKHKEAWDLMEKIAAAADKQDMKAVEALSKEGEKLQADSIAASKECGIDVEKAAKLAPVPGGQGGEAKAEANAEAGAKPEAKEEAKEEAKK